MRTDDSDASTYPGAAFNESDTECMTDAEKLWTENPSDPLFLRKDCDDNDSEAYPESDVPGKSCSIIDEDTGSALLDEDDGILSMRTGVQIPIRNHR